MSKFKVGDKVRCIDNGLAEARLMEGSPYTVSWVEAGGFIRVDKLGGLFSDERFELVEESIEEKREALRSALELVEKYDIQIHWDRSLFSTIYLMSDLSLCFTKDDLINHLLPLETERDKRIREIEEQMRKLADDLEEARGGIDRT